MISSSSESSDQCEEVIGTNEIVSGWHGSELEEEDESLRYAAETVGQSPRLRSKLPEGGIDETRIRLAAAVIAGAADDEAQAVWELKDAVKTKHVRN